MTTLDPSAVQRPSLARRAAWIHSARWDLGWLIGSALIVPIVLLTVWGGVSSASLMLAITALIGGPHLFSTYVVTFMDPAFRRAHGRMLLAITLVIPCLVIWGVIANFPVLLSLFIFAASLHVVQQNAYLTDVYRRRDRRSEAPRARWIDYGLLFICMHPIASWKLVHGQFQLGDVAISLPPILMGWWTYVSVWIVFAFFLVAWLRKTWIEAREDRLNVPKTTLIGATTVIAFFVPAAADGTRLELAFQSVNAWHSIQYLGIVWFALKLRKERGFLRSKFVAGLAGSGRTQSMRFYGFCFGVTVVLLAALYGIVSLDPMGLSFQQYWYTMVLSPLLIHYALDAYLFAVSNREDADPSTLPYTLPAD